MKLLTRLFDRADRCAAQSTWEDLALLKLCLAALGLMLGLAVPARQKKKAGLAAALVFVPTYILLLVRYLPRLLQKKEACWEETPWVDASWDQTGEEDLQQAAPEDALEEQPEG